MPLLTFESRFTQAVYVLGTWEPSTAESHVDRFGARHLLVGYSPVLLRNIGQNDLADDLAAATNSQAGTAWLVVGLDGVVRTFSAALTWAGHDQRVIESFEAFVRADKVHHN